MSGFSTFNRLRLPIDEPPRATRLQATRPTCRVCAQTVSKYTCPRCHVPYCSADCFRTHGEACTEAFYRKHVEDEMKGRGNSDVVDNATLQRRVLDMVRRTAEGDNGDITNNATGVGRASGLDFGDDENDDIGHDRDTLTQLAEMDHLTLEDLTTEQRKAFLRAVADGQISNDIEPWTPWWVELRDVPSERHNHSASRPTITSMGSNNTTTLPVSVRTPGANTVHEICTTTAAPTLKYNLVCVLFSFVETWRHFNGEVMHVDPLEAARELVTGSAVLSEDRRYASTEEAVLLSVEAWMRRQGLDFSDGSSGASGIDSVNDAVEVSFDRSEMLLSDVRDIVSGGQCCIVEALTKTKVLLETSMNDMARDISPMEGVDKVAQEKRHKEAKRLLRRVGKKVDFFIAWGRRLASPDRLALSRELDLELAKLRDRAQLRRNASAARSEARNRKGLVVVEAASSARESEEEKSRAGPLIEEL